MAPVVHALVEFLSMGTNGCLPLCLFLSLFLGSFPSICFVLFKFGFALSYYVLLDPLFPNERQKGVNLEGKRGREELGREGGGKIIIRIYCEINLVSIKEKYFFNLYVYLIKLSLCMPTLQHIVYLFKDSD